MRYPNWVSHYREMRESEGLQPLPLDVSRWDITKLYEQLVLVLGHDIPGAKQEIEAFNYIQTSFLGKAMIHFLYTNVTMEVSPGS